MLPAPVLSAFRSRVPTVTCPGFLNMSIVSLWILLLAQQLFLSMGIFKQERPLHKKLFFCKHMTVQLP